MRFLNEKKKRFFPSHQSFFSVRRIHCARYENTKSYFYGKKIFQFFSTSLEKAPDCPPHGPPLIKAAKFRGKVCQSRKFFSRSRSKFEENKKEIVVHVHNARSGREKQSKGDFWSSHAILWIRHLSVAARSAAQTAVIVANI